MNCDHVRQWNLVMRTLKKVNDEGKAKIVLPKIDMKKVVVVAAIDASFAKEPGMKSQAGFLSFLTTSDVAQGEVPCALVEFQSATFSRVVKSTLAKLFGFVLNGAGQAVVLELAGPKFVACRTAV